MSHEIVTENGKRFVSDAYGVYEVKSDGTRTLVWTSHAELEQRKDSKECDALKSQVSLFEAALRKIANQDYRGNRSAESTIAYTALTQAGIKP